MVALVVPLVYICVTGHCLPSAGSSFTDLHLRRIMVALGIHVHCAHTAAHCGDHCHCRLLSPLLQAHEEDC